jgi:hypothetical protein
MENNYLSLHQETRPYITGFPLGCSDHSTLCVTGITVALIERDPYLHKIIIIHLKSHFEDLLPWDFLV